MNRLNRIERALTGKVRVMRLLLNFAGGYGSIDQCIVYEPYREARRELGQIRVIIKCIRKPYKRVE